MGNLNTLSLITYWNFQFSQFFNEMNFILNQVQLQLLTAIVKLFLKRPTDTQELVQQVLSLATQVCGYIALHSNSNFRVPSTSLNSRWSTWVFMSVQRKILEKDLDFFSLVLKILKKRELLIEVFVCVYKINWTGRNFPVCCREKTLCLFPFFSLKVWGQWKV